MMQLGDSGPPNRQSTSSGLLEVESTAVPHNEGLWNPQSHRSSGSEPVGGGQGMLRPRASRSRGHPCLGTEACLRQLKENWLATLSKQRVAHYQASGNLGGRGVQQQQTGACTARSDPRVRASSTGMGLRWTSAASFLTNARRIHNASPSSANSRLTRPRN